jgi:hypothetical protein
MTHQELLSAVRVLGLGERATLAEIKDRYRTLVKRHHPDSGGAEEAADIYRIIEANKRIMEYVSSYRYGFSEQEYLVQDPEERLRRRFTTDPLWEKG